jgi:hypothetical protein
MVWWPVQHQLNCWVMRPHSAAASQQAATATGLMPLAKVFRPVLSHQQSLQLQSPPVRFRNLLSAVQQLQSQHSQQHSQQHLQSQHSQQHSQQHLYQHPRLQQQDQQHQHQQLKPHQQHQQQQQPPLVLQRPRKQQQQSH